MGGGVVRVGIRGLRHRLRRTGVARASRPEARAEYRGPDRVVLVLVYFVCFAATGSPDATWARVVSWFPATAPIAMPTRIAMGAATWWDPLFAATLTVVVIAGLVVLGGRIYARAVLHSGRLLKLRDVWRHPPAPGPSADEPSTSDFAHNLRPEEADVDTCGVRAQR